LYYNPIGDVTFHLAACFSLPLSLLASAHWIIMYTSVLFINVCYAISIGALEVSWSCHMECSKFIWIYFSNVCVHTLGNFRENFIFFLKFSHLFLKMGKLFPVYCTCLFDSFYSPSVHHIYIVKKYLNFPPILFVFCKGSNTW